MNCVGTFVYGGFGSMYAGCGGSFWSVELLLDLEVGGPKSVYQSFPRGYPLKTGSPCQVMWS